MKHLIVFDIDGTLTDSVEAHHQAFKKGLHAAGMKEMTRKFETFKHYTDSYIAKTIYEAETGQSFTADKFVRFEKTLTEQIRSLIHKEIKIREIF